MHDEVWDCVCFTPKSIPYPKSVPYHSHIHFSVNEVEASSIIDLCLILETYSVKANSHVHF